MRSSANVDRLLASRFFSIGPALCLVLLLAPAGLRAQDARPDTARVPAVLPSGDTVAARERVPPLSSDTAAVVHRRKSTGTAILLSAVLPGAGQFYNESYWKVPVVVGLGIYFASGYLRNNRDAGRYRDLYSQTQAATPDNLGLLRYYHDYREFYKDQRDSFAWYFVILYLVQLADAYVDAALFDFNVSPNLSLRQLPGDPAPAPYSLTLRFRF